MKLRQLLVVSVGAFGLEGTAIAAPAIAAGVDGSSFLVRATNLESRQFNCTITYTLDYVEFGDSKSAPYTDNFVVPPQVNNALVVNHQTAWAASTLTSRDVQWSCI